MDANALKYLLGEHKILFSQQRGDLNIDISSAETLVITPVTLDEQQQGFVMNILKACGLETHIMWIDNIQAVSTYVKKGPALKHLFLFGVTFNDIGISMAQQAIDYLDLNGLLVFSMPDVATLSQNPTMKNYLWQKILKPIFIH